MARHCMIHAALNWGEDSSDNMTLWSFALDYAAYLYNRIPQIKSGITPQEMTTSYKTDHKELARTSLQQLPFKDNWYIASR